MSFFRTSTKPVTEKLAIFDVDGTITPFDGHMHNTLMSAHEEKKIPHDNDQKSLDAQMQYLERHLKDGPHGPVGPCTAKSGRTCKKTIEELQNNGWKVAYASFTDFGNVLKPYSKKFMGLDDKQVDNISIEAWLPYNAQAYTKENYLLQIFFKENFKGFQDMIKGELSKEAKHLPSNVSAEQMAKDIEGFMKNPQELVPSDLLILSSAPKTPEDFKSLPGKNECAWAFVGNDVYFVDKTKNSASKMEFINDEGAEYSADEMIKFKKLFDANIELAQGEKAKLVRPLSEKNNFHFAQAAEFGKEKYGHVNQFLKKVWQDLVAKNGAKVIFDSVKYTDDSSRHIKAAKALGVDAIDADEEATHLDKIAKGCKLEKSQDYTP